jgi:hypothetical protein
VSRASRWSAARRPVPSPPTGPCHCLQRTSRSFRSANQFACDAPDRLSDRSPTLVVSALATAAMPAFSARLPVRAQVGPPASKHTTLTHQTGPGGSACGWSGCPDPACRHPRRPAGSLRHSVSSDSQHVQAACAQLTSSASRVVFTSSIWHMAIGHCFT